MTQLNIYSENKPDQAKIISDFNTIKAELNSLGMDIERWVPKNSLEKDSSNEEILEAYSNQITYIKNSRNFKSVDIISMNANTPKENFLKLREKFLQEHIHTDDEVRYFIEGQGLFVVHHQDKVYSILCEAGDFISVPANTKHWFDMGTKPNFKCIRFFSDESGWVAKFTGDSIASKFPDLDQINSSAPLEVSHTP